jgi:Leucine-rich repeat (LRR) protein
LRRSEPKRVFILLYFNETDSSSSIQKATSGLSGLTHLDLSNDNITGVFPTALYRCRSLQYLDLSYKTTSKGSSRMTSAMASGQT